MLFDVANVAAIASGLLQLLGYLLYIRGSLSHEINPNPVTWLMLSYGTTLLVFLEYEYGAGWRELLLPITCTVGTLVIAMICVVRGTLRFPEPGYELSSFVADVLLTVGYVAFWWVTYSDMNRFEPLKVLAPIGFLLCSNATTFTTFVPILASTAAQPDQERAAPWIVWTLAYACLFLATLPSVSGLENSMLLIYPTMNLTLHAVVALLVLSIGWATRERIKADLYVAKTARTGRGLFARRAFARGELVFRMTGKKRYFESHNKEEAHRFENWVGVGENTHLDPHRPFCFTNHSCNPNMGIRHEVDFVALRDIGADEELTFDYSIATAEVHWAMRCNCDAPWCRQVVRSIHFLPPDFFQMYLPFIGPYFQKVYKEAARHAQRARR